MSLTEPSYTTLSSVLSLGLLFPKISLCKRVRELRHVDAGDAALWLRKHKVADVAARRCVGELDGLDRADREVLAGIGHEIERRKSTKQPVEEELERIRSAWPEAPARLMKGLAAREWYANPSERSLGDLDLWVPTIDDAWRLARAAQNIGFYISTSELPWIKGDLEDRIFGQIRLEPSDGRSRPIDIHAGAYSVRYCGLVVLDHSSCPPWTSPEIEDTVCCIIANAAGDFFIDAKTINDLALVFQSKDIDWLDVWERLEESDLTRFFAGIYEVMSAQCSMPYSGQRTRIGGLVASVDPEPVTLSVHGNKEARRRVVIEHSRRLARTRWRDVVAQPEVLVEEAQEVYSTPATVSVVEGGRSWLPDLNPWTCIRLVPLRMLAEVSEDVKAEPSIGAAAVSNLTHRLELVVSDRGEYVRIDDEFFVPSTDYKVPRESVV